jgi:uncharacterized cupin superfamily protein
VPDHVNTERDVLILVLEGTGVAIVDGVEHRLRRHHALLIAHGARRSIRAGPDGLRYLSVHLRRPPLQIEPA